VIRRINMQILSYSEAKSQGLKRYFTGEVCKKGHISEKQTSNRTCIKCVREHSSENKHIAHFRNKKHYEANKAREQERMKKYREANLPKLALRNMTRYIGKLRATPIWLTKAQFQIMQDFYNLAKECEILTGDKYHVDHIVPLQGKNVCGLHVPWNLQVLPADMNLSKSNKFLN
jgi:hypothetical protein